jgi:hypothetical protein
MQRDPSISWEPVASERWVSRLEYHGGRLAGLDGACSFGSSGCLELTLAHKQALPANSSVEMPGGG